MTGAALSTQQWLSWYSLCFNRFQCFVHCRGLVECMQWSRPSMCALRMLETVLTLYVSSSKESVFLRSGAMCFVVFLLPRCFYVNWRSIVSASWLRHLICLLCFSHDLRFVLRRSFGRLQNSVFILHYSCR